MWPQVHSTCPYKFKSKPCPTKNNCKTLTVAILVERSRMRSRDSGEKTRCSSRAWSCPSRSSSWFRWINTAVGSQPCRSLLAPVERWARGHRHWWGCFILPIPINRTCITQPRNSTSMHQLEISVAVELPRFLIKTTKRQLTTSMVTRPTSPEPAMMSC